MTRLAAALIGRLPNQSQPTRFSSSHAQEHFFFPTTGRWLWNEPHKRQQHTRTFDVEALQHVLAKAAGLDSRTATVCLEKLAEGASNKVFLATIGRQRMIVKIPDPIVPPRLVTASEVATLEFLRAEVELPVPQVFAWSDNSDNPVGCEYIVMEEASGKPLNCVWSTMEIKEKFTVVDEILSVQKRLLAAGRTFSGFGSLYFADDASKLDFRQQLPVTATQSSRFCVGPLAHQHFTGPALIASDVNCGPWRNPQDYLISIAHSSMAQIRARPRKEGCTIASRPFSIPTKTASNTSVAALFDMLEVLCTTIPHITPLSTDQDLPLLWHKDLHLGNIFVSAEGKLTRIIDWQDADVLPLFLGARVPRFIEVDHNTQLLELPEKFSDMPELARFEVWEIYRQSMLQQYYLADLREHVPELAAVMEDQKLAPIRREIEPFARISDGDEIDALLLRETLLRIQRNWSGFVRDKDVALQCPINIDGDELNKHQKDGRRYNEFQDRLNASKINVADEGWVPEDEFVEWKNSLKDVVKETMESFGNPQERLDFEERLGLWNLTDWQTM